jgi:hypothetical protein
MTSGKNKNDETNEWVKWIENGIVGGYIIMISMNFKI